MKIFLILLISLCLSYGSVFDLTNQDKKQIKSSHDKKRILTRYMRFQNFLKSVKELDDIKKLQKTNTYMNKILPTHDSEVFGIDDKWLTPKEFLITGKGDCEDYAIAKYFTLVELGVKKKNLFLSVVKLNNKNSFHMVLLYLKEKDSYPLVIDNLSWKVVPLNIRKDIDPKFAFNEFEAYNFKEKKFNEKVAIDWGEIDKWELLLDKVYKQKK